MSTEQQGSMFDSKFIFTIVLVGVVWMGWQSYLEKKYPSKHPVAPTKVVQEKTATNTDIGKVSNESTPVAPEVPASLPETTLKFSNPTWSFVVSSRGMAIRDVVLNNYTD